MSLLEKHLITERTGTRKAVRPKVNASIKETGEWRPGEFASSNEYKIIVAVETTFWANRAQYESASQAAKRTMLHLLYGESLAYLDEAIHAIFSDDQEAALAALGDLRKELTE